MKLASYLAYGVETFGAVIGDGVVTLGGRLKGGYRTLREALAAGALDEMRRAVKNASPERRLDELRFLPVISQPTKILCAGINYRSHAAETGREVPPQPGMFIRFPDTLVSHEGEMLRPRASTQFDYEGELAVVIGRTARGVKPERALNYVAGYTCFIDGSVRDYQKFSVTAGKNFPATAPLGPWMVTADEIPDPSRLVLTTRLNGKEVQHAGLDQMIHSVARLVSFCSEFTPLYPGDIIATGTPEGVGAYRNPPLWLKAGDVLEVAISEIGTLRARIVDEK
ncbi:MAG TPA: fumarylacetoacetate hydrolase family protein [Xanthobacteraceae bacterium]|nr:fumarylacetoacetate hydrolase family protein [Xanthobacteraceae bacterium]